MNQKNDFESMLFQISQPAFLVQDGIITVVNQNAANRFVECGTEIEGLICEGLEEYRQLQSGILYLSVKICGTQYPCIVNCLNGGKLFTLESEAVQPELQILSLAAQQLDFPVSEISILLEQMEDTEKKAQMNQNLFRLRRIIRNMADASRYETAVPNLQYCNAIAIFQEILEKAQALLSRSGITLNYQLPTQSIYTMINQEMLRRAIYNLLSNAAKFSDDKQTVDAQLKQAGSKLYFTVTSRSNASSAGGNLFSRYLRQPRPEDRKFGLGLGMALIHTAAAIHGGTVLIQPDSREFRVTMSLSITKSKDCSVRCPMLFPDLYGGNDQALIELSDVLSSDLYQ